MSQTPENTNQTRTVTDDGLTEFFLVITPGFETLAEKEISSWLPLGTPIGVERGGLTVRLPLITGCALNRVLKIPTRILLRLASFGCRDFPKLFKKTSGFAWADWVQPGASVDFQASTHKSRLFIKKRIEETCRDGFKKYLRASESAAPAPVKSVVPSAVVGEPVQILVRFDDDVCTVSLDTSGELLHKRGTKLLSAEAPLRETIAAALLSFISSEGPRETAPVTLIDPMIGSGTFVVEAAHLGAVVSSRGYAFETFPRYQRELAGTNQDGPVRRGDSNDVRFARFVGLDIDAKAAEATRGNWRELGDKRELKIEVSDIFDAKPLAIEGKRWLIVNPPYGERLKIEGRLKDYYELLFEACERVAKPDRACFLLPDTARPEKLRAPRRWQLAKTLKFQNGGLPVTALLFLAE